MLAQGHAGYDEVGHDIVCAGISALLYGYLAYVKAHKNEGEVSSFVWDGGLYIRTVGMNGRDNAAWEVTKAGLGLMIQGYPMCVALEEENISQGGREDG